ncbi:hypothetical protein AB0A69_22015 [Streptomyces sp. NPDC045431]|uniref:DUF6895 family protein n=1 Tax=Streptomyces sp. NPDC045431 TaxID=3155613 RepID=UPI0033EBE8E7
MRPGVGAEAGPQVGAGAGPRVGAADRRVLAGALRWVEANLEWFAPGRWEEFLPRRPFRPGPLLELLGLVRVLDRAGVVARDAPLARRALDLAEEAVADAEFGRGLRRGDELFPYHLNLVALLELLGRPQPGPRAVCEELLAADAGGHCRAYKPVLGRLELRYFADRGGFTAPARLPDLGTLYRGSVAALDPDVLQLTASETYALTHALFYATDFGHRRDLLGGAREVARLRGTVRVLLGAQLVRGGLDLLAELLLCDTALTGAYGCDALVYDAWAALAGAARPDGAVPSPVHRPEVLAGLDGGKAEAYVFGTCYHTTLAAALAAAVRAGPVAAERPPGCPPLPGADAAGIGRWAREVPGAGPEVWAPLLAAGVQARDTEAVAAVLGAARRLGHGDDPLVGAAAALLSAWAGP